MKFNVNIFYPILRYIRLLKPNPTHHPTSQIKSFTFQSLENATNLTIFSFNLWQRDKIGTCS